MLPVRLPGSITCLLDRFPFALLRVTRYGQGGLAAVACLPACGRRCSAPALCPTIAEILEVQAAWAAAGA
jgi:hypothetical protein